MGLRPLPRFPACGSDGCSRTRRTVLVPRSRPAFRSSRPERAPLRTLCRERACGLSFRAGIFRGRKLRRRFEKRHLLPFRLAEDRFRKLRNGSSPRFSGDRTSGKGSSPRFFRLADVSWLGALRTVTVGRSAEEAVRSRRSHFLFAAGLFRRLPERNLFEAGVGSSGASWVARRSRFGMKPGTVLSFAGLCGGRTANASDAVSMGKSGTAGRKMAAVKRRGMYARGPCRRT